MSGLLICRLIMLVSATICAHREKLMWCSFELFGCLGTGFGCVGESWAWSAYCADVRA